MTQNTLTAVLERPRHFGLVDRPMPVAGPGEVVVRVAATAVCHTDLGIYTGHHPGVGYPVVMGHEATGLVESVAHAPEAFKEYEANPGRVLRIVIDSESRAQ